MANLKICSFNVKDCNKPERQSQILYSLHKQRCYNLLLQETHFRSSNIPSCSSKYYPTWFHSTNPSGAPIGVSIGFHRSFAQVLSSKLDQHGRFLFLRVSFASRELIIANVYFPNQGHISFGRTFFDQVNAFAGNTPIVLGGDCNFPLDPGLDTSKSPLSPSPRCVV